jgi:hypothetical protein
MVRSPEPETVKPVPEGTVQVMPAVVDVHRTAEVPVVVP